MAKIENQEAGLDFIAKSLKQRLSESLSAEGKKALLVRRGRTATDGITLRLPIGSSEADLGALYDLGEKLIKVQSEQGGFRAKLHIGIEDRRVEITANTKEAMAGKIYEALAMPVPTAKAHTHRG